MVELNLSIINFNTACLGNFIETLENFHLNKHVACKEILFLEETHSVGKDEML